MKLTETFFKYSDRIRYTTKEHEIQYKSELPLRLRNHISGKAIRSRGKNCIQEMYVMMACLKKQEFDQTDCGREVQAFRKCSDHLAAELAIKKKRAQSVATSGHELTTKQMNEFLKKFPQKYD